MEEVREHGRCSSASHLHLLLAALRELQSCGTSPPQRSVQYPGLDLLLRGQNSTSHCLPIPSELEVDGGDEVVSDTALSLHDNQAELEVGQQLHALQQRLQIMENIITALNREVEKNQLNVAALDRHAHNNSQVTEDLDARVSHFVS